MIQHVTRLAPSPTGALHLGNARTFLVNYLLARTRGWQMLMRMEDLDGPRVKAGAANEALADLRWLGLEWDYDCPDQSTRTGAYEAALDQLVAAGQAYPCICSRKDIESAASAPAAEDGVTVYPGTCRGRFRDIEQARHVGDRDPAWRLAVPNEPIAFDDAFAGPQSFNLAETGGDFVIFRSSGLAAYQLAVVIDDEDSGVTDVVRADDLLDSTPRQIWLRHLLGLPGPVRYWHLPLVIGPDGRKLAKRHGDTRLSGYRHEGVSPQRVLGLLAHWCGWMDAPRPISMGELLSGFDLEAIPTGPVVFTPENDAWLRQ